MSIDSLVAKLEAADAGLIGAAEHHRAIKEAIAVLRAVQPSEVLGGLVCRECERPTMHQGTLCFFCSKKWKNDR